MSLTGRHVASSAFPGQRNSEAVQWDASAAGILHNRKIERNKRVFTDAVNYCLLLLKRSDRMSDETSRVPSVRAKLLGREMFEKIVCLDVEGESAVIDGEDDQVDTKDHIMVEADDQVAARHLDDANTWKLEVDEDEDAAGDRIADVKDEDDIGHIGSPRVGDNDPQEVETKETPPQNVVSMNLAYDEHCPPPSSSPRPSPTEPLEFIKFDSIGPSDADDSTDTDDSTDEPYEKTRQQLFVFNLEVKRRVVKLVNENPTWSIQTLRREGSERVRSFRQVKKWERQIAEGGSTRDKYDAVNTMTYSRFVHARDNFQYVDDATLREWATQAALKYFGPEYYYNTDKRWLKKFQQMYEIKGNSAIGYYKKSEKVKRGSRKK